MIDERKNIEKLREHLDELYSIFDNFCKDFGFKYAAQSSLGRYPRIRVQKKDSEIELWFDLWMQLDEQGKRFKTFNPKLPYELSAGACIQISDEAKNRYRYCLILSIFKDFPFNELSISLYDQLNDSLKTIERWTVEDIIKEGKKIKLG